MTNPTFDATTIRERFDDAVDGALSANERRAFDDYLARDADAADEYAAFADAVRALHHAVPGDAPDDHVAAVLAAVDADAGGAPHTSRLPWGVLTHAASAILGAAACLAVVLNLDDGSDATTAVLDAPTAAVVDPAPVVDASPAPIEPAPVARGDEAAVEPTLRPDVGASDVDRTPVEPPSAVPARTAPLLAVRVDGRRLASTWALVRDDIAALLDASLAAARAAAPVEPSPAAHPEPEPALVAVAEPEPAPAPPTDFEWPAELRDVAEPAPSTAPTTVAAAAPPRRSPEPPRDGVRLVSVDDEVAALRSRGALVEVVPTLLSHLGDEDDPATALAADQLDQIAARLARDPVVAPRLVTPRYAAPRDDSWLASWFASDDEPDVPTYDGTLASYWRAWYAANAPLLAERLDAYEA